MVNRHKNNTLYYIMYSYTNQIREDGFGAQYQTIIITYLHCMMNNMQYKYNPFIKVEHNYENDPFYTKKLEELINLKNNIETNIDSIILMFEDIRYNFEENIDNYCNSDAMKYIKECFWQNKEKDPFKNNKINIAVHIRRENSHDRGHAGERASTPNTYYLNIMNEIRETYKHKDGELLFHIYSQGNIENFKDLERKDVQFHLNEDITKTFVELVGANILIISPSSFSYVAALLSDGVVYYKNFWHNPRKEWIVRI